MQLFSVWLNQWHMFGGGAICFGQWEMESVWETCLKTVIFALPFGGAKITYLAFKDSC